MKNKTGQQILIVLIFIIVTFSFTRCKTKIQYVPVETIKTEYMAKHYRDSVFVKDMVRIYQKGDTVYKDSIIPEYRDRDRVRIDTVYRTDSVQVPYEVQLPPVEKKVYPRWLIILAIIGSITIGYFGFKVVKLFL